LNLGIAQLNILLAGARPSAAKALLGVAYAAGAAWRRVAQHGAAQGEERSAQQRGKLGVTV